MEDVKSQGKSASEIEECMMSYFKFPNATYITETLFQELQGGFERSKSLINLKKTNANIADQYSFYFLLQIMTANFQALNFCSVSLTELMEEDTYSAFISTYKSIIVNIIENGYLEDFEAGDSQEEMKQLW
jgi:hypothetical protein